MDKYILRKNRIHLREDPSEAQAQPSHVAALRIALLDFDCTISDRLSIDKDDDLDGIENIYKDLRISEFERTLINETLAEDKGIQDYAGRLSRGKDREREWECFYRDKFFNPLASEMKIDDKDTRRTSRNKYYYDYFEHAQSRHWTLFAGAQSFRKADRQGLSEPRPDWVAFFPIFNFAAGNKADRISTSHRWQWKHSPKDSIIDNFSLKTLEHLSQYGLESNSAGIFRRGRKTPIEPSDCICFPWFIVEHKKKEHSLEEECYCQAANAGAATVMMLQTLSKHCERRGDDIQVPPVATMTTVGEVVRIWITYSCNGSKEFKADCIWKGNMTVVLDIDKLRAILENLHTWAMRVLRPWISSYIDQWRVRYPMPHEMSRKPDAEAETHVTPLSTGQTIFNDKTEAKVFVQGILKEVVHPETDKLLSRMNQMENLLMDSIREREHEQHTRLEAVRSSGTQTTLELTSSLSQHNAQDTAQRKQYSSPSNSQGTQYEVQPEPELDAQNGPSTLHFLYDVTEPAKYETGTRNGRSYSSDYKTSKPSIFTTGVRVLCQKRFIRIKLPEAKIISSSELLSDVTRKPSNILFSKPTGLGDPSLPGATSRPTVLKFDFKKPTPIMKRYSPIVLPTRWEQPVAGTGNPLFGPIEGPVEPGEASGPMSTSNLAQDGTETMTFGIDNVDKGDEADQESNSGSDESQEESSGDDSNDSDYTDGGSDFDCSESGGEPLGNDENGSDFEGKENRSLPSESQGESSGEPSDVSSYQDSAGEDSQEESGIDGIQGKSSQLGTSGEAEELEQELQELKKELTENIEKARWNLFLHNYNLRSR
ncbi:hypothetical protein HJFPF1_13110 [Paramyrothecium foliicola]|nr:hypothetical protein HJFPF1_13110 [Paramyrothecium foliicola]